MIAWYRKHLQYGDLFVSILVGIVMFFWIRFGNGNQTIENVLIDNRGQIFGVLATLFGALLGFMITAVSVIVGFAASDRMALVRKSKSYPVLFRTFTSTIWALALATVIALVSLILDRDGNSSEYFALAVSWISTFSFLRVTWCLYLLEKIIHIAVQTPTSQDSA